MDWDKTVAAIKQQALVHAKRRARTLDPAQFRFKPFSHRQQQVLTWWCKGSPMAECDGVIADGAIRSGKTISMSIAFVLWAFANFDGQQFGMCGKTIGSLNRNVIKPLLPMLRARGYKVTYRRTESLLIVEKGDAQNLFYIFGGRDEASQDLIQGITLAGCLFDEVALMPESFVNQATGRCSVEGSKWWFNCNPGAPLHWFKQKWIDQRKDKNLLYLRFIMTDNLTLSQRMLERYRAMYVGVFYQRYILGRWTVAEGLVYPHYEQAVVPTVSGTDFVAYQLSIDYGTTNPFSVGLWGYAGGKWARCAELYYDSRAEANKLNEAAQKTDAEYYKMLCAFVDKNVPKIKQNRIKSVIIDPSAASFATLIRKSGRFKVRKATNTVKGTGKTEEAVNGIRGVSAALQSGNLVIYDCCTAWIKEAQQYVWKDGRDEPVKEHDHAMDDTRYFVNTNKINRTYRFSFKERQEERTDYNAEMRTVKAL